MSVYYGVVKGGNVIVLPEEVHLTEGLEVEVRALSPEEERSLQLQSEDLFKQRLAELGLLKEIKAPYLAIPTGDRTPINVEGKPLSQTIIEERR
jgi:hypothetical protein